jgi:hypothetical protein
MVTIPQDQIPQARNVAKKLRSAWETAYAIYCCRINQVWLAKTGTSLLDVATMPSVGDEDCLARSWRDACHELQRVLNQLELIDELAPPPGWFWFSNGYSGFNPDRPEGLGDLIPFLKNCSYLGSDLGFWEREIAAPIRRHAASVREVLGGLELVLQPGPFDALRNYVREQLKGKERRVVELLCEHSGVCPIEDLARDPVIDWDRPCDNVFNQAQIRINKKLHQAVPVLRCTWKLSRKGNRAQLKRLPK